MTRFVVMTLVLSMLAITSAQAKTKIKTPIKTTFGGVCSYYTNHSSGHWTANGERFNENELTAANWWLPFNTKVRVTNLKNGKSVVVRVNDRGPAHRLHRCIDLSLAAAHEIGNSGLCVVQVTTEGVDQQLGRVRLFDWDHWHKMSVAALVCIHEDIVR